jgi:hypothetical protein
MPFRRWGMGDSRWLRRGFRSSRRFRRCRRPRHHRRKCRPSRCRHCRLLHRRHRSPRRRLSPCLLVHLRRSLRWPRRLIPTSRCRRRLGRRCQALRPQRPLLPRRHRLADPRLPRRHRPARPPRLRFLPSPCHPSRHRRWPGRRRPSPPCRLIPMPPQRSHRLPRLQMCIRPHFRRSSVRSSCHRGHWLRRCHSCPHCLQCRHSRCHRTVPSTSRCCRRRQPDWPAAMSKISSVSRALPWRAMAMSGGQHEKRIKAR